MRDFLPKNYNSFQSTQVSHANTHSANSWGVDTVRTCMDCMKSYFKVSKTWKYLLSHQITIKITPKDYCPAPCMSNTFSCGGLKLCACKSLYYNPYSDI